MVRVRLYSNCRQRPVDVVLGILESRSPAGISRSRRPPRSRPRCSRSSPIPEVRQLPSQGLSLAQSKLELLTNLLLQLSTEGSSRKFHHFRKVILRPSFRRVYRSPGITYTSRVFTAPLGSSCTGYITSPGLLHAAPQHVKRKAFKTQPRV